LRLGIIWLCSHVIEGSHYNFRVCQRRPDPVSAAADQTLATRKKGLKANVQMANDSLLAGCTAVSPRGISLSVLETG
jgi:hypothetical protein